MEDLYLIVGLGNPGREYAQTRHNAGFMVVQSVLDQSGESWRREDRFEAQLARTSIAGRSSLLCEPQTFMNASGQSVGRVCQYFRIPIDKVLIVVDDADLPIGQIRLRPGGSSGGHHGLDSVESHLGTRDYARQRVGIGRQSQTVREITGHVLGRFTNDEQAIFAKVLDRCRQQIESWIRDGIGKAMSQYNGTVGSD